MTRQRYFPRPTGIFNHTLPKWVIAKQKLFRSLLQEQRYVLGYGSLLSIPVFPFFYEKRAPSFVVYSLMEALWTNGLAGGGGAER